LRRPPSFFWLHSIPLYCWSLGMDIWVVGNSGRTCFLMMEASIHSRRK
jgi:hypothetical protein